MASSFSARDILSSGIEIMVNSCGFSVARIVTPLASLRFNAAQVPAAEGTQGSPIE